MLMNGFPGGEWGMMGSGGGGEWGLRRNDVQMRVKDPKAAQPWIFIDSISTTTSRSDIVPTDEVTSPSNDLMI